MSTMTKLKGSTDNREFRYGFARVKDFKINSHVVDQEQTKSGKVKGSKTVVDSVEIEDQSFGPSKRFWTSIQCRFGFSPNIFRYFDHKEVFDRISYRAPDDRIRYCVEGTKGEQGGRLLAVTNPTASTVKFEQLQDLLNRYNAQDTSYADGIVRSTHSPRAGANEFEIGGDKFLNRFVIDTPVDGFGKPNVYLSLLRLICTNGAIGFAKAFRSEVSVGKNDEDVSFSLIRAMDGFNNEEGFAALRQRFDSATKSWASVNECQKLYNVLMARNGKGELHRQGREVVSTGETIQTAMPIFTSFGKMTGNISEIYGLANLDSLSVKRQRTLPTACRVYDLLNFATEIASHRATENGNRALQAYVGDMLSSEYDLEGTVDQFSDWRDFFVNDSNTADTMRVLQSKKMSESR